MWHTDQWGQGNEESFGTAGKPWVIWTWFARPPRTWLRHGTGGTRKRVTGGPEPRRSLTGTLWLRTNRQSPTTSSVNVSTLLVHVCHTNTLKNLAHPVASRPSA